MKNLKHVLLQAVLADELEYCFDHAYCDNEHWKAINGNETREEAYLKAVKELTAMTVKEIMEAYGDKYDYVCKQNGFKYNHGKQNKLN